MNEFLLGMLSAALGRHVRDRSLNDLQKRLLDAFTGYVAGDGRVLALAGDLVDLVDIDDAALCLLDVVVRGLDQAEQDVFHVLADIAGLRQRRGVGNRKRDVQDLGKRLREEGLAGTGRADQQDVALLDLHVGVFSEVDALVVIVHRDGKRDLRVLLADDIVVHILLHLFGSRELFGVVVGGRCGLIHVLADQAVAELHAFVADIDVIGTGHHSFHLLLAFAAEGAANRFLVGHGGPSFLWVSADR